MAVEMILAVVVSGGLAAYSYLQYKHSEELIAEAHSDNARSLGENIKQRMSLEEGEGATITKKKYSFFETKEE